MKSYQSLLKGYEQEMIQTLRELVSIRSVVEETGKALEEEAPFGEGVQKAFDYMMDRCREMGFETLRTGDYGGHAQIGKGEECMGILVHLDTVPEGEGWTKEPFGGQIEDGKMYGRGTADDKGPAVAALYAMKALKESGVPFYKKVRLIFGLDEEVEEWKGIGRYLEAAGKPDFGFTPDADFPVVHGEKGIMVFALVKKFEKAREKGGLSLVSLKGGEAYNMVPNRCTAVISGGDHEKLRRMAEEFGEKTGYEFFCKGRGKSLEFTAQGLSAHGAKPQFGVNAISIMMMFLSQLSFDQDEVNDFLRFYQEKIGFDIHGGRIDCDFSDDISGEMIWNTGMIEGDKESVRLVVNLRCPISTGQEAVYQAMAPHLDPFGIGVVKIAYKAPIHVDRNSRLVTTLMDVYRKYTGDEKAEPLVIGGGSYARAIDNAVAFGMSFPGEPATEHQKDEWIRLDLWMKAAQMYGEAIYRLCCVKE